MESLVSYASSGSDNEGDSEDETVCNNQSTSQATTSVVASDLRKARETVKITLPSLDQFEEDEEVSVSAKQPIFKSGSGLFNLLPAPKFSSSSDKPGFMPHVLTKPARKKARPVVSKPVLKQAAVVDRAEDIPIMVPDVMEDSDPDDNDACHSNESTAPAVDYFSFESHSSKAQVDPQEEFGSWTEAGSLFSSLPAPAPSIAIRETMPTVCSVPLPPPSSADSSQNHHFHEEQSWNSGPESEISSDFGVSDSVTSDSGHIQKNDRSALLEDERFHRIKGRREAEQINFIDISGADQLTGKDEWLLHSLTEEKVQRPSKRRHDMPTQQQKRKHQITYLAYQAKERELDLKNQWSLNSRTKRETQAKYGF